MYLLDTNVISELRKPRPHAAVIDWLAPVREEDLHLCAVTIGEIQAGIEITREQDPAKASEIESWLNMLAGSWNVLPMDAAAFRAWVRLMHRQPDSLYEDAMIAATAMAHGLTVVTRNTRNFARLKIATINPFDRSAKRR